MANNLTISWNDVKGYEIFKNNIHGLSGKVSLAGMRAINRTGDSTKVQVRRALVKQTGLGNKVLTKSLKTTKASQGTLTYKIDATGGDISLKYFNPRETKQGVIANPFGQRKIFAHSFIFGGQFPNRHGKVRNGHVVIRDTKSRFPLSTVKSGVIIPDEMVQGQSKIAFDKSVREILPRRFGHELARLGI